VGVGHSWWSEQMCAGDTAEAVDVLLTEIGNKRIVVDETARTAKVDAGVILHDFLDYISTYGRGYSTPNFPWFTFQTVAGAVATGSHGSSLSYGSLSSDDMLVALDVVLANGACAHRARDVPVAAG
jgi:FAD/FMN-containing dehydrogenase